MPKATYLTPNEEEAYALAMYEKGYSLEQIKDKMKTATRTEIIEEIKKDMQIREKQAL